jgi:hypothetical protein
MAYCKDCKWWGTGSEEDNDFGTSYKTCGKVEDIDVVIAGMDTEGSLPVFHSEFGCIYHESSKEH